MPAPTSTIWDLEPHSRAKHEILKRYMQAWVLDTWTEFVLRTRVHRRIRFGPGRYSKGENGSPIIALNVTLEQQARIKPKMTFLFVELRKDRAEMLNKVLEDIELPQRFSARVAWGYYV